MRAASLYCFLLLFAGAAQSQTDSLEYTDPFGDGTALPGSAPIEIDAQAPASAALTMTAPAPPCTTLKQYLEMTLFKC